MPDEMTEREEQQAEALRILIRIYNARVMCDPVALIAALKEVDAYFREPNTN
jgi:hypothetical protein